MKYRVNLENRNKSKHLLEYIEQTVGHSLERQIYHSHATAIAGHRHPPLAHQHPQVDDHQRQAHQQQTQGRVGGTGPRPHLMYLTIARLDSKTTTVHLKDLTRFHSPQTINRISKVFSSLTAVTSTTVLQNNRHLGRVGIRLAAVESVTSIVTTPARKQRLDATRTAARRNRDNVGHAPLPQKAKDRH